MDAIESHLDLNNFRERKTVESGNDDSVKIVHDDRRLRCKAMRQHDSRFLFTRTKSTSVRFFAFESECGRSSITQHYDWRRAASALKEIIGESQ